MTTIRRHWLDADDCPHEEVTVWQPGTPDTGVEIVVGPEAESDDVIPAGPMRLVSAADPAADAASWTIDPNSILGLEPRAGARFVTPEEGRRRRVLHDEDATAAADTAEAEIRSMYRARRDKRRAAIEKLAVASGLSVEDIEGLL